ncbi:hypothetical protein KTD31_17275 [Burkholderia multivorans]|nr:hypothetical protein [Burkholderia multivorans]MBU9203110.1 hypothetical protein [Burkholderia multivorans]
MKPQQAATIMAIQIRICVDACMARSNEKARWLSAQRALGAFLESDEIV